MAIVQDGILYPIRFAATSYTLRVEVDAAAETLSFPDTGSLTVGRNYWMSGDAQADASTSGGVGDLLTMLKATLDGHSDTAVFSVALSATTGALTVTSDTSEFQIDWSASTLDSTIFGTPAGQSTPSSSDTDYTSEDSVKGLWIPSLPRRDDSRDRQPTAGSVGLALSGKARASSLLAAPQKTRDVSWALLTKENALEEYAAGQATPDGNTTFERAWSDGLALGRRFRFYEDISSRTSSSYTLYRMRDLVEPMQRDPQFNLRWAVSLPMIRGDYT